MEAMSQESIESPQVIWSGFLTQGVGAGFAFVFRPGRVLGAKKFAQETWIADVGRIADSKERGRALKTIEALEAGRRFEFTADEIQGIEVMPPKKFGGGKIVLRTARGEETVKIAGTFGTGAAGLLEILLERFNGLAPGKVRMTR